MAISIQSQFLAAARKAGLTNDAALLEAKKLFIRGMGATKRRIRDAPARPEGWTPSMGDSVLVKRPTDASYPERYHGITARVKSVSGEYALCDTLRGNHWSTVYAIPFADLYPSSDPPIDPSPIRHRTDAWAGKRVRVDGTDSRHYGSRGTVVRSGRGKCVVRLPAGEYEIAKDALTVVG